MASNTKVKYHKEALRKEALEKADLRVQEAEEYLRELSDKDALVERVKAWREKEEARVANLFRRLGGEDLTDEELASFTVSHKPSIDGFSMVSARRHVNNARRDRDGIAARVEALATDEDGTVSLTRAQVRDHFGL